MSSESLRRLAAAAGLASATAVAGAGTIPPETTVPLGDSYPGGGYTSTYDLQGPLVYDRHGRAYEAYAGYGGFTPPGRAPVERIPVQYLRYYPAAWYGLPGSTLPVVAPQVYMPTDTTQLGFYYQRVPTWAPVPGMIPGPPNPAMFHNYGYGYGVSADGTVVNGTAVNGTVTNERVISVRPLTNGASSSTSGPVQSVPSSNSAPIPPAPSGASELPLQPPPAPASETSGAPAVFNPLPTTQRLQPVGLER